MHLSKLALGTGAVILAAVLASCGGVARVTPLGPAPKTTTPVQDPARHDLTMFNKTVRELENSTTTTIVRRRITLPETS